MAALAIAAGEACIGLAVGAERMGKAGLLGRAARSGRDRGPRTFAPSGRYGSVMSVEGLLGTQTMPGVFSHASTEYALRHGVTFEQFARVAQKNHAHSTLNPRPGTRRSSPSRRSRPETWWPGRTRC